MSSRDTHYILHPPLGGLDVSSDPTVLDHNYVTVSDNIEYLDAGQRKKRGGMMPFIPTTSGRGESHPILSTATPVRSHLDVWLDNGIAFNQRYAAVTGGSIYLTAASSASVQGPPKGYWFPITTASSFGSASNIGTYMTQASSYVVVSDGVTAPIAVNMAATTLVGPTTGAAWPVFEHSVYHLRRLWMGGLSTDPSSIIASAASNIFDSTGTDSQLIPINGGDGDRIVGISQPFFGSLYAFKGPNHGSVWSLSGATIPFTLTQVIQGAPALSHAGIITTPTDVYWISRYGVHSLQATVKYGNVEQAFLSLPLSRWWRNRRLNTNDLTNAKGFWSPYHNIVGWAITPEAQTGTGTRTWLIIYNYALSDPSPGGKKFWSVWKLGNGAGITSLATMLNSTAWTPRVSVSNDQYLYIGADDGQLYMIGDAEQDDNGSAYTAIVSTPVMSAFKTAAGDIPETSEKSFSGAVTFYSARSTTAQSPSEVTLNITVDGRQQTFTITLSPGGAGLG